MKSKVSQRNMFLRIIKTPIRALCKARDLYVKSLSDYGDRMNLGNVMAVQGTLPRSFSTTVRNTGKGDDSPPELLRAASARTTGGGVGYGGVPRAMPPRSSSVAMGRIDEDRPFNNFGEDLFNNNNIISAKSGIKYPRSRSHAVTYSRRLI